jgi:hypothetical protein
MQADHRQTRRSPRRFEPLGASRVPSTAARHRRRTRRVSTSQYTASPMKRRNFVRSCDPPHVREVPCVYGWHSVALRGVCRTSAKGHIAVKCGW